MTDRFAYPTRLTRRFGDKQSESAYGLFQITEDAARDVNGPRMSWSAACIGDNGDAATAGVPRFHRRPLVGLGERRQHSVRRVDVREVSRNDLLLVPLRSAAEVAAHRIDRLEPDVA